MADVVIVVGTKRGKEHVSPIDVKQMIGRAGRKHGGETAQAHVIVEDDRIDEIKEELEQGKNMEVKSSFGVVENVFFHLMPEISAGRITSLELAEKWFERSLASHQGKKIEFLKVFKKMEEIGAIRQIMPGQGIVATRVGKVASDYYFHPADVQAWKDNFTTLFNMGIENDTASIAWALGTRPHATSVGDFGDHRFVIEECKSAIPLGIAVQPGMVIQVVLWWCAMGGPPTGKMRNQMIALKEDIGRIKRVLDKLNDICGWERDSYFDDMEIMIRKGIGFNLLDLCKLPGITKGRADFLYNMGVRDASGVADVLNDIKDDIDEPFAEALKGIVNEFSRKSR
jgi:hypothetical protein